MKVTIERKIEIFLLVGLSIFGVTILGSAAWLPGRVAVQLNFGGEPDAWGTRAQAIILMVAGFLLVTGIWLFRLVRAFDNAPTQA